MAQDPDAGIGEVFAAENGGTYPALIVNGVVTATSVYKVDSVQGSGVLVAPDEILTAAHAVSAKDGSTREIDSVTVNGQSYGVSNLEMLQWTSDSAMSNAESAKDMALLHLAKPVLGGTVFALGQDMIAGSASAAGYPISGGGRLIHQTGDFSTRLPGLLSGNANDGPDLHGESGGPLYRQSPAMNTVYGVFSTGDSSLMNAKALGPDDVATIRAWMANDHSDPVVALASAISGDAASRPHLFGAMNDVAGALEQAYIDHPEGALTGAVSDEAALLIQGNSTTPTQALSFLGGLNAAEAGIVGQANVMSFVSDLFGINAGQKAAMTGLNEGRLHIG